MALEAGDGFISGLVATNPVNATDQVAQGDDHIRLIKTALKGSFPNVNGAVNFTPAQANILVTDGAGAGILADLAALAAPGADRLVFWDHSALAATFLTAGSGLAITTTTIAVDGTIVPLLAATDQSFTGSVVRFANTSGGRIALSDTDATSGARIFVLQSINANFRLTVTSNGLTVVEECLIIEANGSSEITKVRWEGDEFELNSTLFDNNATTLEFAGTIAAAGVPNASPNEVGWKGVPLVSKTADYTIAAVDSGTELVLTSAADDITVQASGQPAAGCVVFLKNLTGGSVDILQGTGMTLTLDGTATTGSRTLAANGRAYVRFTGAGTADVGGLGVA